ncbi:hypothetical protein ODJ79_45355 [Actinoplanes sp. KI2]|uniref:hypothetical protein n=1 Tax=Actinoplanes sp. KI2 TaxID=2983315 RepID=UPI0021D57CF1|nr:hypothetical protein [Actinoplanes sp. KI2]MCU7730987.1 hypothetical protein [Actinoplanes sp. KI2]
MRAAFDKLISEAGLLLAVVFVLVGGLLAYAHNYIGNGLNDQRSTHDITMPEGAALEKFPTADQDALKPYASSPMDTGRRPRRTPITTSRRT